MTLWQDNVARFTEQAATDSNDPRITRERTTAVRDAFNLILNGRRLGRAEYVLARSLRRQLQHAGIGDLQLGPDAPPHGVGPRPTAVPPAPRHRKALS